MLERIADEPSRIPPQAMRGDSAGGKMPERETAWTALGLILPTVLVLAAAAMVAMTIVALAIGFPLPSALAYAFSNVFFVVSGLPALIAVVWLVGAPGRSAVRAAREWNEVRDVRTAARAIGFAVLSGAAVLLVIELIRATLTLIS